MNIKLMLLDNSPGKWISKEGFIRKSDILFFVLVLGFVFCFTNGFAFGDGEGKVVDDGVAIPEGGLEFRRVPNLIIGSNDFEKMRDLRRNEQDYILGRKVAFLLIPDGSGNLWRCTGFLVGPDLLMTNHHCIHNEQTGRRYPITDIEIYMDYYQEPNVDSTRGGITAGVSEVLRADALKDYALLRLDTSIGNTYGWLELDATTTTDTSMSVKIIQHPRGRSKEIARKNSDIINIPWDDKLAYSFLNYCVGYLADMQRGSSGSPVFLRDGRTKVIAINTYEKPNLFQLDYNAGGLMSYIVPEIQQWLPSDPASDLAVRNLQVTGGDLSPGENFTLSVTVQNFGTAIFPGTTLRFYRATGPPEKPLTNVSEVGTVTVPGLGLPTSGWSTSEHSITLSAPTAPGTYYYYAGADKANNEFKTYNNYSVEVSVTVSPAGTGPDRLDVNRDGRVSVLDLVLVAVYYGTRRAGLRADVNTDEVVNVQDFELVAAGVDAAADALPQQTVEAVLLAAAEQAAEIEAITGGPMGFNMPQHVLIPDTTTPPNLMDVNRDGQVNVLDLVLVAVYYGTRRAGLRADVNTDEVVNVQDFELVAAGVDAAADALPQQTVEAVLLAAAEQAAEVEAVAGGPMGFNMPQYVSIPDTTTLLPNYPNPFNPETWIPYQLAKDSKVTVHIYDARGALVRTLPLGHQRAGLYYTRSRAAYWDGRNAQGESVTSGAYFYTLKAGDFTATRKMLIRK